MVQETEYTAAGKLPSSQLTFAKENDIEVRRGEPDNDVPGKVIVIPESIEQFRLKEYNVPDIRKSYIKNAVEITKSHEPSQEDIKFLAEDSNASLDFVRETVVSLKSD